MLKFAACVVQKALQCYPEWMMILAIDPTDLRREPRKLFKHRYPITAKEGFEGAVLDISPSGLGIVATKALIPNDVLTVSFAGRVKDIRAKIVWCKPVPTSGKIIKAQPANPWRAGLQFLFSKDAERDLINELFLSL
jgi:hypothetical protein